MEQERKIISKETETQRQINLAKKYLKWLHLFKEAGGIDSKPPLTKEEYQGYNRDNDPFRESNLEKYKRRLYYYSTRKELEQIEEELNTVGLNPDRRAYDFVQSLPEEIRKQIEGSQEARM